MFNEVSTGASNDFQNATKIARAMVTEYGMSDLGPVQYEQPNGSIFLGRDYNKEKNFSEQVALEIDRETRKIIETCYEEARKCITENKRLLCIIAEYLKRVETLTKSDIDEINSTGHLMWFDKKHKADPVLIDGVPVVDPSSLEDEIKPVEPTTNVATEEPLKSEESDIEVGTIPSFENKDENKDENNEDWQISKGESNY